MERKPRSTWSTRPANISWLLKTAARSLEPNLPSKRKGIDWHIDAHTGVNNPNFNGGKYIDDKGYVRVLRPRHPSNIVGYVYEHRLLMEAFLDRYLQSWETVHHINEEKLDNRLNNLYLCTGSEHTAIHSEGRHLTWKHKDTLRATASRTAERRRGRKVVKRDLNKKDARRPRDRAVVVYDDSNANTEVI